MFQTTVFYVLLKEVFPLEIHRGIFVDVYKCSRQALYWSANACQLSLTLWKSKSPGGS